MFDLNTVYKITVIYPERSVFSGLAIGIKPIRSRDGGGVIRDGFEWIPNSGYWLRKHAYLRVTTVGDNGIVEAVDTENEDMGTSITYVFEPVTIDNLESVRDDISNFDAIVKPTDSNGDINEFFREDWWRDDWAALPQTSENLVMQHAAKELVEIQAAPIGDIRYWKSKGWMQKTRDGWLSVDGPAEAKDAVTGTVATVSGKAFQKKPDGSWKGVEGGPRGELPGRWKDESEGLPKNTRDAHWDSSKNSYTLARKVKHNAIRDSILNRVKPVDNSVAKPQAVITMGIPASGKSKAVGSMLDTSNHAHIDPDNIREQLPEFQAAIAQRARDGGSIVADETNNIADEVLAEAVGRNMNVLLEGVVSDPDWYENELIPDLKRSGYDVAVMMVHEPDADAAVARAELRGLKKGRFVPERHIREAQPKLPSNFKKLAHLLDSFAVYSSGTPPRKMWSKENGREIVHDQEAFDDFQKLTESRWFDVLLASKLRSAGDKPTEMPWDDFLGIMEKAWDIDQADLENAPEVEGGVEIPMVDIVKSRKQ